MNLYKKTLLTCSVLTLLASCSAATHPGSGDDAYWNDKRWDAALLDAVQSAIQVPQDSATHYKQPLHVKVAFTYMDGKVAGPEIMESTGYPELDAGILKQIAGLPLPKATGPRASESHAFALQLDVPTSMDRFEEDLRTAVDASMFYPKQAVMQGSQGLVLVAFDYLDGNASNVTVYKSASDKSLDAAAVHAVEKAKLPAPLPQFGSKPVHLVIAICYSLGPSDICPQTKRTVQVVEQTPAQSP